MKTNDDKSTTVGFDLTPSIAKQTVGAPIVVDYHATVNTDVKVIDDILSNSAYLEYSNTPGHHEYHHKTSTTEKHLFTYGFNIVKQDRDSKKALAGAEFTVSKDGASDALGFSKVGGGYVLDPTSKNVTLTTDDTGKISLGGLDAGTYAVKETKAPEGYEGSVLPSFKVTITGRGNANTSTTLQDGKPSYDFGVDTWKLSTWDADTATVTVDNVTSLTQLPLTGGAGIILFAVVALVFGGAGVILVYRARSVSVAR